MKLILPAISALFLLNSVSKTLSANILVIVPCPARSHFAVFDALVSELAERRHNLWVVSHFPRKTNGSANYIDIDISGTIPTFHNNISLPDLELFHMFFGFAGLFKDVDNSAKILETKKLQNLLKTDIKFDLILAEQFSNDMFLGFAYKFKVPWISVVSSIPLPWTLDRVSNVDNPSYTTNMFTVYSCEMDFRQRLVNTVNLVFSKLMYVYINYYSEGYARRFFGEDLPPLSSLVKNTSMLFVNSFPVFNGVRPYTPQVIEIGGIHMKPAKDLPNDLEKFLNESEHGVVYFSMGSMVRLSTLTPEQHSAFTTVFSRLHQRVLWKWEEDVMPNQPANVKIAKWLPQRDILAHPKVKLFITHGGLMGLTEALYSGVPVVGIPLFGDQPANLAAVEAAGTGLKISFHNITADSVGYAVNTVLNDPKFAANAKKLSELYRDRPMSPLDTAVYWVEYVIRHKGAAHLQSPAAHLAWYQYLLLDVVAFIAVVLVMFVAVVYYVTRYSFSLLLSIIRKKNVKKMKKS